MIKRFVSNDTRGIDTRAEIESREKFKEKIECLGLSDRESKTCAKKGVEALILEAMER